MNQLAHLATRIFGKPLAINRTGLDVILGVLAPRLNLSDAPPVSAEQTARRRENKPYVVTDDGIAVIDVVGPLVNRASGDALSGGPTTYGELSEEILDAGTDPLIKGIVLEVDSPGGEVGGLFDLCDLIAEVKKSKPVFGVATEDAFSAAYAIISTCTKVFLTQTGGLGSIGVIALHCDQSEFDSNIGVKYTAIYAGEKKNDFTPHAPLSSDAKDWLQGMVNGTYDKFVSLVSKNRGISDKAVRGTEAQLYFGQKAIDAGLGDQIGTLQDAVAAMGAKVNPTIDRARATKTGLENAPVPQVAEAQSSAEDFGQAASASPIPQKEAVNMAKNEDDQKPMDDKKDPMEDTDDAKAKTAKKGEKMDEKQEALSDVPNSAASEIADLCEIAGKPELVGKFITERLTVQQVRTQLRELRAGAQAPATSSAASQQISNAIAALTGKAKQTAEARGITKEAAFTQLLIQNPQAYADFKADHTARAARVSSGMETVASALAHMQYGGL